MRSDIAKLILTRLTEEQETLKKQYKKKSDTTRFFYLDELLPTPLAREIHNAFGGGNMRLMDSFREKKYTTKNLNQFPKVLEEITFAFQAPEVVQAIEKITGLSHQSPDSHLYAGGLSKMTQGHFLHPHIDNSHDGERKLYRTLNLLYDVIPDWKPENGGNLELWDVEVKKRTTLPSLFNRLVVMETNRTSWHSVSPVKAEGNRTCVSNYYFSPQSPDGGEYFHITAFSAPPEEPLKRIIAQVDNLARSAMRKFFKHGLGKKDVFRAKDSPPKDSK